MANTNANANANASRDQPALGFNSLQGRVDYNLKGRGRSILPFMLLSLWIFQSCKSPVDLYSHHFKNNLFF
jgi:hypothetical protein